MNILDFVLYCIGESGKKERFGYLLLGLKKLANEGFDFINL